YAMPDQPERQRLAQRFLVLTPILDNYDCGSREKWLDSGAGSTRKRREGSTSLASFTLLNTAVKSAKLDPTNPGICWWRLDGDDAVKGVSRAL
ncbi:MAG: hypothetical protein RL328_619, partial [Acidobacteriota bacterium]